MTVWTETSGGAQAGTGVGVGGSVGADVAAADTITLSEFITSITGAGTIKTINGLVSGRIYFLVAAAGSTWTLAVGGNIASAFQPTEGEVVQIIKHGATVKVGNKRYPSVDGSLFGLSEVGNTQTQLNSAITFMKALPSGGILTIPRGTFNAVLWSATSVNLNKQIIIRGAGRNATVIRHIGDSGAGRKTLLDLSGSSRMIFEDMTFTTDLIDNGKETLVFLGRLSTSDICNGHVFRNCNFEASYLKALVALIAAEDCHFINCRFTAYGQSASFSAGLSANAIYVGTTNTGTLSFTVPSGGTIGATTSTLNNHFIDCVIVANNVGSNFYLEEEINIYVSDCDITSDPLLAAPKAGLLFKAENGLTSRYGSVVQRCLFELNDASSSGVLLEGNASSDTSFYGVRVFGNTFTHCQYAMKMTGKAYARELSWRDNRYYPASGEILLANKVDGNSLIETAGQITTANNTAIDLAARLRAGTVSIGAGTTWPGVQMEVAVPATATSTGIKGQTAYDYTNKKRYKCTDTNVWVVAAAADVTF